MQAAKPPPTDRSGRTLALVFSAVIGSFLATTAIIQWISLEVDHLSDSIANNTTPTIERLASLRASTFAVEFALARKLQTGVSKSSVAPSTEAALATLADEVADYLSLPSFPDERVHLYAVQQTWARFDESVRRTLELLRAGSNDDAWSMLANYVEPSGKRLLDASMNAIRFNAQMGRELADEIREHRRRTIWIANGLSALCVVLGAAGAVLLHRQSRHRRLMVQRYAEALEIRAAELEQFAGRVAHDIRNPLGTVQMSAEFGLEQTADPKLKDLWRRALGGVARANAITTDLLEFARAGASPDPGARTDPRGTITDLLGPFKEEAEHAGIEIEFRPGTPAFVACSPGVYMSLVSNLVRNAIKYMGSSPTRRITVSISSEGSMVRTEVADTGPGIKEQHLDSLFEPYFRGRSAEREGLGLGLATVKRLAESHHGRVSVRSTPGKGSAFWFELPRAGAPEARNHRPPP